MQLDVSINHTALLVASLAAGGSLISEGVEDMGTGCEHDVSFAENEIDKNH